MNKFYGFIFVVFCIFVLVFFSSCNLTRTVTTESSYFQRGDTTTSITTRTVETYEGKKLN